jgi:hypothetical protein
MDGHHDALGHQCPAVLAADAELVEPGQGDEAEHDRGLLGDGAVEAAAHEPPSYRRGTTANLRP